MDAEIKSFIQKYNLEKEKALVLAISGGPDSMVLLDLFVKNYPNEKLVIAHANHGLRLEARWDEVFVKKVAEEYELKFAAERLHLTTTSEAEARDGRYEFLRKVATENKAKYIVTAHHLNDQAETMLFSMLRGVGPLSLWGMCEAEGDVLRPFIHTSKKELADYAKASRLAYHLDRSNFDVRFARNRIRSKVIPVLTKLNPKFLEAVDRLSENGQGMSVLVEKMLKTKTKNIIKGNRVDIKKLQKEVPYVQREVIKHFLEENIEKAEGITSVNIQKVLDLTVLPGQKQTEFGKKMIKKVGSNLVLTEKKKKVAKVASKPIKLELETPVSVGGLRIKLSKGGGKATKNNILLPKSIGYNLSIRNWREGDRIKTKAGTKKLQDLFTDAKIELSARKQWPVIVSGRTILWVPKLAAHMSALPESKSDVIKIEVKSERKQK